MMLRKTMVMMAAAALLTLGCDSGSKSGGDSPKGSAAAAGDENAAGADVPVPEDFEEEAQQKVTQDSYEDQLANMEKEIEGDKE